MYDIKSVTSQTAVHPASNIKNLDLYRTWQTEKWQQKAIIELKLEKPTNIKHLQIGECSVCSFCIVILKVYIISYR